MKKTGFTLIELLITVAIIGILASVAYPAYTGYVTAARRADAKVALAAFANGMERYYTVNSSYIGAVVGDVPIATVAPAQVPATGTPYYTLTATPVTATTYTLLATPQGGQVSDSCGTLTQDETGAHPGAPPGCW